MAKQFDVMAPVNEGSNPIGSSDTIKVMQTVIMFITYGFAALWFLTKLVAYIVGRRNLDGDTAKAYIRDASA